jgi:type III restriction enzyme
VFRDTGAGSLEYSETGVANRLTLTEQEILNNVRAVQERNGLKPVENLEPMRYVDKDVSLTRTVVAPFVNLSLEMETGTGKTYVYLRTIYELHARYGFKKFVVVVPSVAIREGVWKTMELTDEHFAVLYGKPKRNRSLYDSKKLADLRNFAMSDGIEILLINIDSFAKDENVINQVRERGIKPLDYLRRSRPVVILDEPQNMETDIRKKAVASLHPSLVLRYSATHREIYNPVYRLDPVRAYELGLVKQISVWSVLAKNDQSSAFVSLDAVKAGTRSVSARLTIYAETMFGVQKKAVDVSPGDDLFNLSGYREVYKDGYVVDTVERRADGKWSLTFDNGTTIVEKQAVGTLSEHILREQIDAAVDIHLRREIELRRLGIKVLTLFFIDRVAHYREYLPDGTARKGKFARWFEECYRRRRDRILQQPELWDRADYLKSLPVESVHDGYFAQDRKSGRFKDSTDGKRGPSGDDEKAYELIMRDKERLLDLNEPLRFIFSHSALREGWDNPNVFQICTLAESRSEIKKRQEIGRGLRLAVNSEGLRVKSREVNRLVVISNESYEEFAQKLQTEIEQDCGVRFGAERIKNERARVKLKLNKHYALDENFVELWNRIKARTRYRVRYDGAALIRAIARELRGGPEISVPTIRHVRADVVMDSTAVRSVVREVRHTRLKDPTMFSVPDFIRYIRSKTRLSRRAVAAILVESGALPALYVNPQATMEAVVRAVENCRRALMIDGIQYEKIHGREYEMRLFEDREIERFKDRLMAVKKQAKTLYDYVEVDSDVERRFMEDCENRDDVLFYFKLPYWFTVPTPLGEYNPDWALVMKDESKLYFVAETKSTQDFSLLRETESGKIRCAEKHFAVLEGVEYRHVTSVEELVG